MSGQPPRPVVAQLHLRRQAAERMPRTGDPCTCRDPAACRTREHGPRVLSRVERYAARCAVEHLRAAGLPAVLPPWVLRQIEDGS